MCLVLSLGGQAMRRREFLSLVSAATAWPLAAGAQQSGQISRVGLLGSAPGNPLFDPGYSALVGELRKLGFTEGQNLIIENRRVDEGADKAFAAAGELSQGDIFLTFAPKISLKAAIAASQTTPIVMIAVNYDPIARGYVSNIARPDK